MNGWWKLEVMIEGNKVSRDNVSDITKEHIAEMIKEGYTQGEVIEEE